MLASVPWSENAVTVESSAEVARMLERFDAEVAQGDHHRGDVADDDHQAAEEGREAQPERREAEVEDEQDAQVDDREQAEELGDLAAHPRGRRHAAPPRGGT